MSSRQGPAQPARFAGEILYQGLLRSTASWARVGRGYLGAFLRSGLTVRAIASRGFAHDPDFPLPPGLELLSPREAHARPLPDLGLGFLHPPKLDRLIGRRKVNLIVWEADRVPMGWIAPLRDGVERVAVPSRFTAAALAASGYPEERIIVAPYGYDAAPEEDRGQGDGAGRRAAIGAEAPFTFLALVAPHRRKGVHELLVAYASAFRAADPVRLLLKTTYDPAASRRRFPFEIDGWERALLDAGLRQPSAPRVELRVERLTDEETIDLYREADVVVQPSWGEAFGLALLEAMAAGRPVVTTGWGGQVEFAPPGDDLLPYRLAAAGDALYEPVPGARVAIPETEALAARLRWHFEHPEESRGRGVAGRKHVRGMTWDHAARVLLERLAFASPV